MKKLIKGVVMRHLVILITSTVFTVAVKAEMRVLDLNPSPAIGPIERDYRGNVLRLEHREAIDYCETMGSRLPTPREYAQFAKEMGAMGVSETPKGGYYVILGSDSEGDPDHFYFRDKGYQRPEGDLGNHWFWSSGHRYRASRAFHFSGLVGSIGDITRSYPRAFRCVAVN